GKRVGGVLGIHERGPTCDRWEVREATPDRRLIPGDEDPRETVRERSPVGGRDDRRRVAEIRRSPEPIELVLGWSLHRTDLLRKNATDNLLELSHCAPPTGPRYTDAARPG